ncbi:MAG: hypothetical protein Q7K45_04110 [Nanoarchaeota archaeon]|nr:hypothetical protein [Nanoarchaeota archaeon]
MATFKHPSRKKRLIKLGRQTKWAPFWTVFKVYGKGKKRHPSRHTYIKRTWRRTKTKA